MDLDALKELARTAYGKKYAEKTPLGFAEKFFLNPAITLFGGGLLAVLGAAGALAFGVAAGPVLVLAAGLLAMAAAMPLLLAGAIAGQGRADRALERDIENGSVVERFRKEILGQKETLASVGPEAGPAPFPASSLDDVSAKAAFNNPPSPDPLATITPVAQKPASGPATPGA